MSSLEPHDLQGLSEVEAARRLAADGPNALPRDGRHGWLAVVWQVVREPMFLLLIVCGVLYLLLGDPKEASLLLGSVVLVVGLTIVQERRTENALAALEAQSSPHALVIRDGARRRVASSEVVRGDHVVVSEGDRVPADGLLRWSQHLSAEEGLLTGEAVAVRKVATGPDAGAIDAVAPGGDDSPWVYSGTLVVAGQGVMEVQAIGAGTAMGRIGAALAAVETGRSRLQEETRSIVRIVGTGGALLCSALVLIYGLTRGEWIEGLLAGLATAMALLPEEVPVVLTVFLAIGAWRISRKQVLTRRMAAIEALGATTVLCSDKTGTLTENQMAVRALHTPTHSRQVDSGEETLEEPFHLLVEHAILAGQVEPFDPMEKAFRQLGTATLLETEHLHPDWQLRKEYPLSSELLAMTRTWLDASGGPVEGVSAKGAPEAIFDLCHLSPAEVAVHDAEVQRMAALGLRVLGVASAQHDGSLPDHQHDFAFRLEGLIGLEDPLRQGIPEAVATCRSAGIRVLMITGDYPVTAKSIALQAGLGESEPLTGPELATLSDEALSARLEGLTVAARIAPEDKLRLVLALQRQGEIVAMTGDGVNDAPALKAAQIGIAMGKRGTDVAREAAALVLVDDDFGHIVEAVALGRRIFDNLRQAMAYIVAVHVPIAGLAIVPVVVGWPAALMPVHIVFLELVIDPACSIVFEAETADPEGMTRPPRQPDERMLSGRVLGIALLQGLALWGVVTLLYAYNLADVEAARSMAFAALLSGNIALILGNRSWTLSAVALLKRPNKAFGWIVAFALGALLSLLYLPGLNTLLHFAPLSLAQLGVSMGAGALTLLWVELVKRFA